MLKPDQRESIDAFLQERDLPEVPSQGFLQAAQEVLSGLVRVAVTADNLRSALFPAGSPASPAELRKRLDGYLDQLTKGLDPAKVRIVLE